MAFNKKLKKLFETTTICIKKLGFINIILLMKKILGEIFNLKSSFHK